MATRARTVPSIARRTRTRPLSVGPALRRVAGYAMMVLVTALMIVPLLWMLSAAFKTTPEIYRTPVTLLPEHINLKNFRAAWNAVPFERFYINSLFVTGVVASVKVLNSVLSAYALVF